MPDGGVRARAAARGSRGPAVAIATWHATPRGRARRRAFATCSCGPTASELAELAAWIDAGAVRPLIHRSYPLAEVARGLRRARARPRARQDRRDDLAAEKPPVSARPPPVRREPAGDLVLVVSCVATRLRRHDERAAGARRDQADFAAELALSPKLLASNSSPRAVMHRRVSGLESTRRTPPWLIHTTASWRGEKLRPTGNCRRLRCPLPGLCGAWFGTLDWRWRATGSGSLTVRLGRAAGSGLTLGFHTFGLHVGIGLLGGELGLALLCSLSRTAARSRPACRARAACRRARSPLAVPELALGLRPREQRLDVGRGSNQFLERSVGGGLVAWSACTPLANAVLRACCFGAAVAIPLHARIIGVISACRCAPTSTDCVFASSRAAVSRPRRRRVRTRSARSPRASRRTRRRTTRAPPTRSRSRSTSRSDVETLFAWAQAERQLGNCQKASELYDKLLEMDMPAENKQAVRDKLEECKAQLAAAEAQAARGQAGGQARGQARACRRPSRRRSRSPSRSRHRRSSIPSHRRTIPAAVDIAAGIAIR